MNRIQQALIDKVKKKYGGNIDEAIEELAKSGKSPIELFDENDHDFVEIWEPLVTGIDFPVMRIALIDDFFGGHVLLENKGP